MIDLTSLKQRVPLAAQIEQDGHQLRRSGASLVCRCMFHDERTPSLHVFPDGRFKCFGCGEAGDVLDYIQKTRGVGLKEATRLLGGSEPIGSCSPVGKQRAVSAIAENPAPLTEAQLAEMRGMAETLRQDYRRVQQIAEARGLKPETVRSLALEYSLGWHAGQLAFIYERKIKLRRGRDFTWQFKGQPVSLWRGWLLSLKAVRRVYICEGETDAISLLDAGAEDRECKIVAAPSASTFKREWGPLFAGKEAVIAFDNDDAGEAGAADATAIVRQHARSVSRLNWKGVQA